jgi:hypothetical protein
MGAILNEAASVSRQQRNEPTPRSTREHAAWPRFSANASRHAEIGANGQPVAAAGLRNWTAGELAALLCEVLKREHAALAACHGQRVETDWIPLARSLAIRLAETPGMTLATSPLKTRFLLREQIGAWLVHNALDVDAAHSVLIALPDSWNSGRVLSYLFRHEIAPMHYVTASVRSNNQPISGTTPIREELSVSA